MNALNNENCPLSRKVARAWSSLSFALHFSRGWWGKWETTTKQIIKATFFPNFFGCKKKVLLCLVFPGIKAARRRILNFKWLIFEKWTVGCIVVSDILRVYGVLSTNSRQNSSEDTPDSNSCKTTKTTIQVRITQLPLNKLKTRIKQRKNDSWSNLRKERELSDLLDGRLSMVERWVERPTAGIWQYGRLFLL